MKVDLLRKMQQLISESFEHNIPQDIPLSSSGELISQIEQFRASFFAVLPLVISW